MPSTVLPSVTCVTPTGIDTLWLRYSKTSFAPGEDPNDSTESGPIKHLDPSSAHPRWRTVAGTEPLAVPERGNFVCGRQGLVLLHPSGTSAWNGKRFVPLTHASRPRSSRTVAPGGRAVTGRRRLGDLGRSVPLATARRRVGPTVDSPARACRGRPSATSSSTRPPTRRRTSSSSTPSGSRLASGLRGGVVGWESSVRARRGAARFANSQSSGRVSRGSMISSIMNASAVLNGLRARDEARLDLGPQRGRILRGFELRAVRGLDPAFERERSPLTRRPREPVREARRVLVRGAGDAVDLADQHRAPRHRRLVHRGERAGAVADRARLLGRGADQEARVVDEVHDREPERLREVDEPLDLARRVRGPTAGVVVRIVREHRDRPAVEPREPGDRGAAPPATDLEERVRVERPTSMIERTL